MSKEINSKSGSESDPIQALLNFNFFHFIILLGPTFNGLQPIFEFGFSLKLDW